MADLQRESDGGIAALQDPLKQASPRQQAEIEKHNAEAKTEYATRKAEIEKRLAKAEYETQKAKLTDASKHIKEALRS